MNTDYNLLFGVLALQADLIDAARFAEACSAWAAGKNTSLADLLVERGWLTGADRADVEKVLQRKLDKHSGDARASLAEVSNEQVRQSLAGVDDPEIHQTLLGATTYALEQGPLTTAYVPESCGRYILSRLHKEGGIGRVWLARDGSLRRNVALKELLPQHAGQPPLQARFLKEAQVTGQLEHPGIVPIYEVGRRTDEQTPFYTMRFVHGRTLFEAARDFHRRWREGTAQVLELRKLLADFVVVCNTVAYAHSRGVLHRDLKPANIALGEYGEVIVLDWGLARLIDDRDADPIVPAVEADNGADETQEGQVLGTLPYMSPEQAQGRLDLLGPVSDVYGLGAILYVILTGQPPFIEKDKTVLLQQVVHVEPPRPRSIVPGTPAALEAVCLKALAKRQEDRYGSAKELADEVQLWLADEPVAACREPWTVRAARWARRRRTLVVGTAVFLLCAVVALSVSTALVVREQRQTAKEKQQAEQERDRAEKNFEAARQLSFHLIQISEQKLSSVSQSEPARAALLDAALGTFQPFLRERPDEPQLQEHVALMHRYWANFHRLLGDPATVDRSYRESIRLWEKLVASEGVTPYQRIQLAETLRDSSPMQKRMGKLSEASQRLQRSREIAEGLQAEAPGEAKYRRLLVTVLLELAEVEQTRGRFQQAGGTYRQAAGQCRVLLAGPREQLDRLFLAVALKGLGTCQRELRQLSEAADSHGDAVKQLRGMLKERADINVTIYLGRALVEQGQTLAKLPTRGTDAERCLDEAVKIWEDVCNRLPQIVLFQEGKAVALRARAEVRTTRDHLELAQKDLDTSMSILAGLAKKFPAVSAHRAQLGKTYGALGRLALARQNAGKAAEWFGKAVDSLREARKQDEENALLRASLGEFEGEARRLEGQRGINPPGGSKGQ
jgi:serine/threonine-protein kinase